MYIHLFSGCIYGKGSQYAGNASVSASGKECLSWGDEKVAYPLEVNVSFRILIFFYFSFNWKRKNFLNTKLSIKQKKKINVIFRLLIEK